MTFPIVAEFPCAEVKQPCFELAFQHAYFADQDLLVQVPQDRLLPAESIRRHATALLFCRTVAVDSKRLGPRPIGRREYALRDSPEVQHDRFRMRRVRCANSHALS